MPVGMLRSHLDLTHEQSLAHCGFVERIGKEISCYGNFFTHSVLMQLVPFFEHNYFTCINI